MRSGDKSKVVTLARVAATFPWVTVQLENQAFKNSTIMLEDLNQLVEAPLDDLPGGFLTSVFASLIPKEGKFVKGAVKNPVLCLQLASEAYQHALSLKINKTRDWVSKNAYEKL